MNGTSRWPSHPPRRHQGREEPQASNRL